MNPSPTSGTVEAETHVVGLCKSRDTQTAIVGETKLHLHFTDFNVIFFKKSLMQVPFEKNTRLCKKREKKLVASKNHSPSPLNINWSFPN